MRFVDSMIQECYEEVLAEMIERDGPNEAS